MHLREQDLKYIIQRTPRDIVKLLKDNANRIFMGGGYLRAMIAGEEPNDIDLFGNSKQAVTNAIASLTALRRSDGDRCRLHTTVNAVTLITANRLTVQGILRWSFSTGEECMQSFDFTVCQAVVWWSGTRWESCISEAFYPDLAARRLVYTNPVREEEAGGSMLRVLKYTKRGYSIQVISLGAVIARLIAGVKEERMPKMNSDTQAWSFVISGLLREVDPSLMVDGIDVVDDEHEVEQ